jgi:hypothetical protein
VLLLLIASGVHDGGIKVDKKCVLV